MKADSGVSLNTWLIAQKKSISTLVGTFCLSNFFFPSNFLGLTVEITSFKLLISHELSRMEVIKFIITKEMYFGTEM